MSFVRHRRVASVITSALLALMLIGPGTVQAAVPVLTPSWTVIPTTVHNGDYVAFRASIKNDDTSTVSQLYLVELVARDPNLTLFSISPSQGSCDTSGATFMCSLGQLKPNRTATVTAVFSTAATGTSATERWEFNTTGLGSGGGDNSHGDSWSSFFTDDSETVVDLLKVALSSSDDFGGRYVLNNNLKIVENSQALSSANPHSTRAYAPVTGIGVTVEDIDCLTTTDADALLLCAQFTTGFGQVSLVNVNDDVDDSGITATTLLHFYLQLDSSEIPQGTNANAVSVFHVYPGGSETIETSCTFAKKGTTPNNAPCITVKNLPGGDMGVDVWTFHNGGLRLQ